MTLLQEVMTMAESSQYAEEIITDLFRNIASDLIFFVLFQVSYFYPCSITYYITRVC